MNAEILWTPSMPPMLIATMAAIGVLLILVQWIRAGAKGVVWRALLLGALTLALIEPSISVEERVQENDIAVVVIDETTSQKIGERQAQTQAAATALIEELEATEGMEVII